MMSGLSALPLHPMLVHFPIALYVACLVLDGISFIFKKIELHQAAITVYVFAALMSPLTVLTGLREEDRLKIHHPLLELHEKFGLITMWTGVCSLIILGIFYLRKMKYPRWSFLVLSAVLVALAAMTAFYGGRMVYEYGVGVTP